MQPRHTLQTAAAALLLAAAPFAMAQPSHQPAQHGHGAANATRPNPATAATPAADSRAMDELQAAAQRLRESIQTLAQTPPGAQRNEAIRQGSRALIEVQNAMLALPPEVQRDKATTSEADTRRAMDRLQAAAQRLRDAAQTLARQPAGADRNEAVQTINKALLETQQMMIELPMNRS